MSLTRSMGRIWPDGEFVLWSESKKFVSDPEQSIPLGLSEVANSHKIPEDSIERCRQGLNGITKYGQRMVKNAAYLLQKKYGGRQISFLTCTIPGSPERTIEVALKWEQIVRVYYQKLKRKLVANKLSPVVVGVTEIQPRRFKRTGGMPLHLHLVFQGAHEDFNWVFKPSDFQKWWMDTVESIVPSASKESYASSTNVQRVKKSAAGYLGKYMSKGSGDIAAIIEECPTVVDALPHCWYNMSAEARKAVKVHTRYGPDVGELLEEWRRPWRKGPDPFRFIGLGQIRNPEGEVVCTFRFGQLEVFAFRQAGLPLTKYEIHGV